MPPRFTVRWLTTILNLNSTPDNNGLSIRRPLTISRVASELASVASASPCATTANRPPLSRAAKSLSPMARRSRSAASSISFSLNSSPNSATSPCQFCTSIKNNALTVLLLLARDMTRMSRSTSTVLVASPVSGSVTLADELRSLLSLSSRLRHTSDK